LSCTGGCHDGETEVTTNTNHRSKDEDQTCTGGTQSYCCSGFKPPISKEQVAEKFKDEASDLALEAAETLALEIAAKAFCRAAIMLATLPLRVIPIVGWIASIALQVAMPALVQVCSKAVAKGGKSVFKFKGKDYEVKVDKPLTSKVDRPASKEPTRAPTKPQSCKTKKLAARAPPQLADKIEWTTPTYMNPPGRLTSIRRCNGEKASQACYNYSSIINREPRLQYLTCPSERYMVAPRPQVDDYNDQHHTDWSSGWMRSRELECQRDEYPGASIWNARDNSVWIRLIPRKDNAAANHLFRGCPMKEQDELIGSRSVDRRVDCNRTYHIWQRTLRKMETVMDIRFTKMEKMGPDFGISENLCWPSTLVNDPGFALLTNDPWYRQGNNRGAYTQYYDQEPLAQFTNGKINQYTWGWTSPYTSGNSNSAPDTDSDGDTEMPDAPPSDDEDNDPSFPGGRRSLEDLDTFKRSPNELVIHEGNSTREPTKEELLDDLGLLKCEDQHCQREMEELGFASLPVVHETATIPAVAEAVATAVTTGASPDASGSEFALEVPLKVSDAVKSMITPAPRHPHYHHSHHHSHHHV
jgi:hypothetical protein